jgi:hypothetical protein
VTVIDLSFSGWNAKAIAASVVAILWVPLATGFGQEARWINPDFEEGEPGRMPTGWSFPKILADHGFTAVLTAEHPQSGRLCVEIRWPATEPGPGLFANLRQSMDAVPLRNKRIKVTAAIRIASAEDGKRAQMMVRVDREGGLGAFDNMKDRPVTSSAWADYSITVDVAGDAQQITLGLLTFGHATAWWDNIRTEVVGQFSTSQDPPRPLDDVGMRNLVAFSRLLGYVRHFHPSDAAAAQDWLRFAVDAMPMLENARDPAALAAGLQTAFSPVAPTVRVFETGKEPAVPSELQPPAGAGPWKVRFWEHLGYRPSEASIAKEVYSSRRLTIEANDVSLLPSYAVPSNVFRADLGGGVSCQVPCSLFVDASVTPAAGPVLDASQPRFSVSHRGARLATAMLAWNVLQHFYPYFDVIGTDWHKELQVALRAAATDPNDAAFFHTLNRLAAALHDGHASLSGPGLPVAAPLQARVELIEGKIVVTGVPPETPDLKPGDVVERIEGRPALEVFDEIAAEISSATPQWRAWKAAQQFGPRPPAFPATLEVRGPDGSVRTVKVGCSGPKADAALRRPAKVHEIKPGIWYVDATRLTWPDFDAALPSLAKAKGLVFDMRGYPSGDPAEWLVHLSPKNLQSAFFNIPRMHRPDRTVVEWDGTGRWNLESRQPQFTANRVFLTDGSAISYAESVMGIVEACRLGEIVGEPTAGTNGNINSIELPLGYTLWFTGMKVLKHDGTQHHGIGIKPTVPVARTIHGVREGRDEQLERALDLVRKVVP